MRQDKDFPHCCHAEMSQLKISCGKKAMTKCTRLRVDLEYEIAAANQLRYSDWMEHNDWPITWVQEEFNVACGLVCELYVYGFKYVNMSVMLMHAPFNFNVALSQIHFHNPNSTEIFHQGNFQISSYNITKGEFLMDWVPLFMTLTLQFLSPCGYVVCQRASAWSHET